HDVHAIAHTLADLFKGLEADAQLLTRDIAAARLAGRHVEWPDLHCRDATLEQTLRKRLGAMSKSIQILVRSFAGVRAPVRQRSEIAGAHVAVTSAGVVDAQAIEAASAEQLMNRLIATLAEEVPEGEVEGRGRPVLDPGGRLRHRQGGHRGI